MYEIFDRSYINRTALLVLVFSCTKFDLQVTHTHLHGPSQVVHCSVVFCENSLNLNQLLCGSRKSRKTCSIFRRNAYTITTTSVGVILSNKKCFQTKVKVYIYRGALNRRSRIRGKLTFFFGGKYNWATDCNSVKLLLYYTAFEGTGEAEAKVAHMNYERRKERT